MPYHQRIDLRVNFGGRRQFATEEARRAYEDECIDARSRQTVQFAVAPRTTLPTRRGVLQPGDEVVSDDFEGAPCATRDGRGDVRRHAVPAWRALRDAIADGRVLERL
jgi:hypothetical protein